MRIAIDARPLTEKKVRGIGRVGFFLVRELIQHNPDHTFILWTSGWKKPTFPSEFAQATNIEHQHLRIPNKIFSALTILNLTSIDNHFDADVIFLLNIGFLGHLKKPYAILLHDLSYLLEPRWFTWKQRIWHKLVKPKTTIRRANAIFSVSQRTKTDAHRLLGIDEQRIEVIPIGPTLECKAIQHSARDGSILIFGDNDPRKNTRTSKRAVELLRRAMNNNSYHIVAVNDSTAPNDQTLVELYSKASAILYPSWYEGYGLPLHEAAQCGTPRVASTTGALPETAPPGTHFANPMKPHHIARALEEAIKESTHQPIEPDDTAWKQAEGIIKTSLNNIHHSRCP